MANINETYSLLITNNGYINVTAPTVIGIVYAFETLSQLTLTNSTSCFVAAVSVMDSPRFPHRGLLLDTARNFFPVSDIKRQMDAMGSAKMNGKNREKKKRQHFFKSKFLVFHWHVYDAQSFPLTWAYGDNGALFKAGAYRTNYSSGASGSYKVYSQSDINDLVQYALYRGIRIIPEFDIPGHSAVFGDAYPELMSCVNASPWTGNCAQPPCGQFNPSSPGVYSFLESFLIDMSQWFPDPVIHLGMDEVSAKCWNTTGLNDPVFKKSIKDFVTRVAAVVQANGKRLMGWDEMIRSYSLSSFPGGVGSSILPQDTMIQVWEGAKGGAIDITQSNLTLADDQTQNMISIAVSLGYSVVASPSSAWYLDCSSHQTWCASTDNSNGGSKAVWHDWKKVYDYDPTSNLSETLSPSQITTSVMGGEGCMWSETLKRDNIDGMIWPRAAAVAERLWSPQLIAVRTNRTEARLDRFRASLVNQYNISASLTGDLVGEIQVGGKYMVEWCDFNLNSPAQRSSDGSNYCSNAASYDTQTIVPTIPSPIVYPY